MAAGIPGVGIGGIFYLASALVMPLREIALVLRGTPGAGSAARWRPIARAWLTGWMLGQALRAPLRASDGPAGTPATHVVGLRAAALLLSFGTLTVVLLL